MKVEGNKLWERRMERAFGWGGRTRDGGRECRRGRRREKTTLSLSLSPNKTPDMREILKLKCRWSVTTSSSWSADRAGLQIVRDFQPLQSFLSISIIIIWASRVSMLPILSQTDELNIPAKLYSTGRSSHALFRWFVGCWYFVHSSCNHHKWLKDFRCLLTGSHVQSKLSIPKQFHMICFVCSTQYCFYCRYTNHFCNDVGPLWASESDLNFYYKHKKVLYLLTLIWFSCFSTLQRTALCESVIWSMNHLRQSISESWYVSSHFQCFHSTKSLSLKL